MLVIMCAAFAVESLLYGEPLDAGHAAALGLTAMELVVMVAVATLFSAFTTPMLASLFTVGVYLLGHLTRDLYQLGSQATSDSVDLVATFLYRVLPDLESFNLTIQAVHGLEITAAEIWWPVLYGFGYATVILIAATMLFERRDFR